MWVFIATGYVCEHMKVRGEDKLKGFMLSFHHVGPGDGLQQVIRLRGQIPLPTEIFNWPYTKLYFIYSFIHL